MKKLLLIASVLAVAVGSAIAKPADCKCADCGGSCCPCECKAGCC